jgi:hypothetical protein
MVKVPPLALEDIIKHYNLGGKPGIDKVLLQNSIRLLIGGYLYDDGDIEDIPGILDDIADDYRKEIIQQIHKSATQ